MTSSALNRNKETIKTILMDDLLEVIDSTELIMKMDIEGAECRALANSSQLFDKVKVHRIWMEWAKMAENLRHRTDMMLITDTVATLRRRGFEPQANGRRLEDRNMQGWPGDIVWVRK